MTYKVQLVLALSALLCTCVSARPVPCLGPLDPTWPLPGVQDLTPETFDAFVNGSKHALVMFYAPWCHYSWDLTPEYKTLAESVANDSRFKDSVVIAKVDADKYKCLGKRFDVKAFPAIYWFPHNQPAPVTNFHKYKSERTAPALLDFITGKFMTINFARSQSAPAEESSALVSQKPAEKDIGSAPDTASSVAEGVSASASQSAGEAKTKGEGYLNTIASKSSDYFNRKISELNRTRFTFWSIYQVADTNRMQVNIVPAAQEPNQIVY